MLTQDEKQILGIFGKRLLVRKDELRSVLAQSGINDGALSINKLNSLGYLKFIEAVGAPCYTITQDGLRALKA
jgi:hypothetical protein